MIRRTNAVCHRCIARQARGDWSQVGPKAWTTTTSATAAATAASASRRWISSTRTVYQRQHDPDESECKKETEGNVDAKPKFRILFCGSDEFSVASLKAVHQAKDLWKSIDVVVPPEREVGRGGKHKHHEKAIETYTPVLRRYAEKHGLPITEVPPTGIKTWVPPSSFSACSSPSAAPSPPSSSTPSSSSAASHLLLTASFGHIIPLRLLKLFPADHRLNVHPSLLPRWRGAAPVQWTIANGDSETGVSVQRLVKYSLGVDAGDLVGVEKGIKVPQDATYNTFLPHLAGIGGQLLVEVLRKLQNGTATFTSQLPDPKDDGIDDPADTDTEITFAPKITLETARIRWSDQTAEEIDGLHRGIHHQYPLWTTMSDKSVQFLSLRLVHLHSAENHLLLPLTSSSPKENTARNCNHEDGQPAVEDASHSELHCRESGTAHLIKEGKNRRLFVRCAHGTWIEVLTLQTAGKKGLEIKEWWNGLPKGLREGQGVKFN